MNRHTAQCTSPVQVVSQCKVVWLITEKKRISVPRYGISGTCEVTETGIFRSYNTKMQKARKKWFKNVCRVTEIVVDTANVRQMTSKKDWKKNQ